jgi:hypothetical protein
MLAELGDCLSKFRNGRREVDSYTVHQIVKNEIELHFLPFTKNPDELESLLEDLENFAYMKVAMRYGRFRDSFRWIRPQRTRRPRIRYDLKTKVLHLTREDNVFKSFLVNATLLEFCEELRKDPEGFWENVKRELDEVNSENDH